jgi:serine/threonine-protein kinase RsbT
MMNVEKSERLGIHSEPDVVQVRQKVRAWAIELSFGAVDQTKIVTAASEIARNTLVYGKGGSVTIQRVSKNLRTGICLIFEDNGPGIADIDQALTDGFSTGRSMGLGLGGAKRLVNEFDVESESGKGTRVTLIRWK